MAYGYKFGSIDIERSVLNFLVVVAPHDRLKQNLATHLILEYYYDTGFGDLKVVCDPFLLKSTYIDRVCQRFRLNLGN